MESHVQCDISIAVPVYYGFSVMGVELMAAQFLLATYEADKFCLFCLICCLPLCGNLTFSNETKNNSISLFLLQ